MRNQLLMIIKSVTFLVVAILVFGSANVNLVQAQAPSGSRPELLTIGSKAPAIDIENWVSDGDGTFDSVKSFKNGKVYVIEFWATWCGPCIASMPHLSKLQEEFLDKSVQIISVTDEDMETVDEFLKMKVRGKDDTTYGELTSNYCLTSDPDESTSTAYLRAARQNGIPSAFIVGKTGLIEWIGHPARMESPLTQVVTGNWDRVAFGTNFKAEQEAEMAREAAQEKLHLAMQPVAEKFQAGKTGEAMAMLDDLIANDEFASLKEDLVFTKIDLALSAGGPTATKAFRQALQQLKDAPDALHEIAWSIYSMKADGEDISDDLLTVALEAAKKAAAASPNSPEILDTIAHIHYVMGDLDNAISAQKTALENAAGMEEQVKPFLKKLEAEKAKQ